MSRKPKRDAEIPVTTDTPVQWFEGPEDAVDLNLLPPLSGGWNVDLPVARLSSAVSCN